MKSPFERAIAAFDYLNQQDPRKIIYEDSLCGYEYVYSIWLTEWIQKLEEEPSEALLLAARSQHLKRWKIPRTDYEEGKVGYLKWRKFLYQYHADEAAKILQNVAYEVEIIGQVQEIILKQNRSTNADSQSMEDALCLVFLEYQLEDFILKTPEEKMPGIIEKSWKKMSEKGHKLALTISYSEKALKLIKESLNLS